MESNNKEARLSSVYTSLDWDEESMFIDSDTSYELYAEAYIQVKREEETEEDEEFLAKQAEDYDLWRLYSPSYDDACYAANTAESMVAQDWKRALHKGVYERQFNGLLGPTVKAALKQEARQSGLLKKVWIHLNLPL